MFHEYALEPTVLSDWASARYFLEAFGPWKGRFLVEYPKTWKKLVREGLNCKDIEKHRIIERLHTIDRRIFVRRDDAKYDTALTWRENATIEHERKPFHAVIVSSNPVAEFLEADIVSDDHPLWRVEPGQNIPRTAVDYVKTLSPLLHASRHIAIIDPHFRADNADKTHIISQLYQALSGRPVKIDIHVCEEHLSYHEFARIANRALPRILPPNFSLTLRSWAERRGGERFHNRFIITDLGGVQFGDGIQDGEKGQSDRLSLLGSTEHTRLWNLFYGNTRGFDLAGPDIVVTGIK